MDEQMQPGHWRYRKNLKAGIITRLKEDEDAKTKEDFITCEVYDGNVKSSKSVRAEYDALIGLTRDEQVTICKALKVRGYSDLNEEGIVKKILAAHDRTKKGRRGVTTAKTLGLDKVGKKKLKIQDDEK